MAVAVNVLSGRADAGMAIYASARALGLDFIPVAEERYDLVIPEACWEDAKVQLVMEIIGTGSFRQMVEAWEAMMCVNRGCSWGAGTEKGGCKLMESIVYRPIGISSFALH